MARAIFRLARCSILFCLAGLVSCGHDDQGSADLTVDQFAVATADVTCDNYVRCGRVPDRASCHLTPMSGWFPTLRNDMAAGQVEFDGHLARQCLTLLTAELAGCPFHQVSSDADIATCEGVFTGHGSAGAPCFLDNECSPGLACAKSATVCSNQCCAGLCQARPAPIPVGGPCARGDLCVTGGYCQFAGAMGTCTTATSEAGTPCTSAAACAAPLVCVPDYLRGRTTFTASCLRPVGTGGDCSDSSGNYCDDIRDHCDPASARCVRLAAVGDPCDPDSIDTCVYHSWCDARTKTCVARGDVGDACSTVLDVDCIETLSCDKATSTCQAPGAPVCMAT